MIRYRQMRVKVITALLSQLLLTAPTFAATNYGEGYYNEGVYSLGSGNLPITGEGMIIGLLSVAALGGAYYLWNWAKKRRKRSS